MRGFPGHYYYGPRFFSGGLGLLLSLLILGLLIYLVLLIKRDREQSPALSTSREPAPAGPGPLTPMEVLKMRYARGEISREEYETMRRDLE